MAILYIEYYVNYEINRLKTNRILQEEGLEVTGHFIYFKLIYTFYQHTI